MKFLALSWAEGKTKALLKFDYLFFISLRNARDRNPIEELIINEHKELHGKVQPEEIKSILNGSIHNKVLIILDGYDEYKEGTNPFIEKVTNRKALRNCWLILTSRETEHLAKFRDIMDAEMEIHGFNKNSINSYIKNIARNKQEAEKLWFHAVNMKITDLLEVPMVLNMVCSVIISKSERSALTTKAEIYETIISMCMNRETLRAKGQKAEQKANQTLVRLGELAWQGLQKQEYIFEMVDLVFICISLSAVRRS